MNDKKVKFFVVSSVIAIIGITILSKQIVARGTKVDFKPFTKVNRTPAKEQAPVKSSKEDSEAVKSKPTSQNTKSFTRNGYHEFKVIDSVETAIAGTDMTERVTVSETDFKYPFMCKIETLQRNDKGEIIVVDEKRMVADHMIVRTKETTTYDEFKALVQRYNSSILSKLAGRDTYIVGFNNKTANGLRQMIKNFLSEPQIAYAESDYFVTGEDIVPNDPSYSTEMWNLENTGQYGGKVDKDIDAGAAWVTTKGSKNVKIAVIDTGVDYTHPDLAANIWTNPGETGLDANGNDKATNGIDDDGNGYIDDVHGYDFYNYDGDPMDDYFHGTHVAGTIAAVGNNGIGIAGVCWTATIVPLKFLNEYGGGVISDAVNAVYYATRMGCKMTSNSWSGGGFDQSLSDAIADANTHGVLFVAAAGNDGLNIDTTANLTYPACYTSANVVSVAAVDNMGNLASFSNYGYKNTDIAAPGVSIYSTLPVVPTQAMNDYLLDPNYGYLSGTSMATPHVSGVLGLIFAKYPTTTVAQAIDRLKQRSDHTTTLMTKVAWSSTLNANECVRTNWAPYAANIQRVYTSMSDPEGNKNGVANRGETVQFQPTLMNLGNVAVSNAVLNLTCSDSRVKVLSTPVALGTFSGVTRKTAGSPIKVSLSTTFSNQVNVTMNYVVTNSTGFCKTMPFTVTVKP